MKKTRRYGMLEITAGKNEIALTYMSMMPSRVQDVQESLAKLVGLPLAKRFMKTAILNGRANYCLVAQLPKANAPKLFEQMENAL